MAQDQSLTDPSARQAAETERPIESRGRSLAADVRHAFWLIGQYIRHEPLIAIGLFGFVVGSSFLGTYAFMQLQVQLADLTNALVAKNAGVVAGLIYALLALSAVLFVIGLLTAWCALTLRMRFRQNLAPRLVDRWISQNRFFHLERQSPLDFPEQRIQEDTFLFAERFMTIGPGIISALFSIYLYSGQLWSLSPPVSLPSIGITDPIPGFLVYFAFAFGILFTIVVHLAGASLTRVEVVRQHLEAQFRSEMAAVRQNSEAVAFVRGAETERQRLFATFDLIRRNWRSFTWSNMKIDFVRSVPEMLMRVAPTLLLAPYVLNGEMQVGDIGLVAVSLGQVNLGVGVITLYYAELAIFRSSTARLRLLHEQLAMDIRSDVDVADEDRADIVTRGLRIAFPDGRPMNDVGDLTIAKGDRLLIQGRSGAGKSTLLRAIAGLWPFGGGQVRLPRNAKIAFLPQRPYMPDDTLAGLMAYPQRADAHADVAYADLLTRLGLGRLIPQLHDHAAWSRSLSPGEQQRVAAARAILAEPDFLFVDEATSALDPALEATLYALLAERLPGAALVSIAHRTDVQKYHDTVLRFENGNTSLASLGVSPDAPGA